MFQIVVQDDNRNIIGVGPFPEGTTSADFGEGYTMYDIEDDAQMGILQTNEFCYLMADGKHIQAGDPPTG